LLLNVAFHYYGNDFLLLVLVSSPFLIMFGDFIISALAKVNKEKNEQKIMRINKGGIYSDIPY